MRFSDLITDAGTGQMSGSKIWGHVANLIVSALTIYYALTRNLSYEWLLIYAGVVGSSQVASKFLSLRYGAREVPPTEPKP